MLWPLFILGFLSPNWERTESAEKAVYRYTALQRDGSPSQVFYEYDIRSDSLVKHQSIDESAEILALEPNLHLWGAHPEFLRSSEDFFCEAMLRIGIRISAPDRLHPLNDRIAAAERIEGEYPKTVQDLIDRTEINVTETRKSLLGFLELPFVRDLKSAFEKIDVIEPYQAEVSHEEFFVDAFVLSPLNAYQRHPRLFLSVIKDLQRSMPIYPLRWFVETRELFPIHLRLAALMLLTHNHQNEVLLIQAVALQEGLEAAWALSLSLSEIYDGEREFWIQNSEFRRTDSKLSIASPSDISFMDKRQRWLVNVSAKERIFSPLIAFSSVNKRDTEVWLPFFQLYHFYGAFIVSTRMIREIGMTDDLVGLASEALGVTYKIKTAGWKRDQINRMRQFYSQGASDALLLKSF